MSDQQEIANGVLVYVDEHLWTSSATASQTQLDR